MLPPESPLRQPSSFLERHLTSLSAIRRGSESNEESRGALGLILLHEPQEPLIDFIFVHGLRGGSRKTWSKSEDIRHFWPQQWLPSEPRFKNVRLHSFGYNSDWVERKGSALTIHDFGQALLGEIHNSPRICGSDVDTPIVLIGHSMGGVVIKKAFLLTRQDPSYRSLGDRFHSMFFLATPHRGADSAQLLGNIIRLSVSHNSKAYVGDLAPNSGTIQVVNDEFRHVYAGTQLWSFFETVPTSLGFIVEKDSAVLGLPGERVQLLNADHRHVCKFDNPSDSNYCTLRNAFVSTIDSIEKTWFPFRKDEHRAQMRLLSQYLGISEKPEVDLISVLDKKVEGSCEWFISSTTFQQWADSTTHTYPKYFWLSGGPATGKSTIAGSVIRYLEESKGDCMYFFFKDGDALKSTVSEMLRSFAWQMAWTNSAVRQVLLEMEHGGDQIDKTDARALWRAVFVSRIFQIEFQQPCYWIIDALDECSSHNTLFPLLARIDQNFPLRMFLTSRPSLSIERLFSQEKIPRYAEAITRESSKCDIQLFLHANSRYLPVEDDSEREELVRRILDKSNGNFLWTSLVLKELMTIHSKEQIHEVLKSVPEEMDGLYTRILDHLSTASRNKELAKAVLKWTVCAARPLTVEELKEALSFDIGETLPRLEQTAGALCGHLVYVDSKSRVQTAHQTVRTFLLQAHGSSEFAFDRQRMHTRLSEVCLQYLCSEEMKTLRYRRGSSSGRAVKRSAFAHYAAVHFADHLARSTSSNDVQLASLNAFLQTNSLTWIELIAQGRDLYPLTQTAKHLNAYLERRAKYFSPLGEEVQNVSAWSRDLIQLVARFGKALLASPHAIQFLIPPVCPPESIIARTFKDYPRALQMFGLSHKEWDDQLCCIGLPDTRALSVDCRDNRFAVGASDGVIRIYSATTFQEELKLTHGEPVRNLDFGSINTVLASAGRTKIHVWDSYSGTLRKSIDISDQILALDFNVDNSLLMVATKANALRFWNVADGMEVDTCQFSDVDEEHGTEFNYLRPPTHAAFSSELNLLAVAYRQRPVSLWDLEDSTFVGQLHKSAVTYPGPLIFALIFNKNPGLSLAAVAYDDGNVATFDVWTQKQQASTDADVATLASSSDGTILATGDAVGTITLYEFETLKLLYRINSFEQSIRGMVFSSNNLRFFDIRGEHCNVWQPSVLVRGSDGEAASSIDISDGVPCGPQLGNTRTNDDDRAITAITVHHDGELLFCGREDGSVAVYSTKTGEAVKELFSHTKNVAVLFVDWSQPGNLLASIDRSGRFLVKKIVGISSGRIEIGSQILDRKISKVAVQLLLSPDGKRLLISMERSDQLWNLEEAVLLQTRSIGRPRTSWKYLLHPSNSEQLLLFEGHQVHMFEWSNFEQTSLTGGHDIGFDSTFSKFFSSVQSSSVCASFTSARANGQVPILRLIPTKLLGLQGEKSQNILHYDKLAKYLKCVVGYCKSTLVILTHDGWICSINADNQTRAQEHYTRHFFIPSRFHNTAGDLVMLVTVKGSIVLVHGDELVVFHNGLDFEEQVDLETRVTSPKPHGRLSLRRPSPGLRTVTS